MRMLIALAATTVAALTLACGGDDEESTVEVSLDEWSVTASPSSASSGSVTFTVSNDGDEPHEFLVIRSDLAPGALPVDENGKVIEDDVDAVDEIEAFSSGTTEELKLDLDAGNYVLICNIIEFPPGEDPESHYQNGMRTAFTVE